MTSERTEALFALWLRVNEIAGTTEDSTAIRALIAEAGIQPNVHVGWPPEDFTPPVVAEWVLGQWADMIDSGGAFLNSARNISFHQYEKVVGPLPPMAPVGGKGWFREEIASVVQAMGDPS